MTKALLVQPQAILLFMLEPYTIIIATRKDDRSTQTSPRKKTEKSTQFSYYGLLCTWHNKKCFPVCIMVCSFFLREYIHSWKKVSKKSSDFSRNENVCERATKNCIQSSLLESSRGKKEKGRKKRNMGRKRKTIFPVE